ncbi:MAG TPA: TetR/AcrR family transcriptional regulator, partial [Solirubrobacteraceae bacterium]|nr:TetR/AcrR family transcriptional regulator [Solirubrobacteraceae bacterium]
MAGISVENSAPTEPAQERQPLAHEQPAPSQRQRLMQAMIDVVGEQGYAKTTVAHVIARAGVSRKSFYQHFANKQACLLETYDAITAQAVAHVTEAYLRERDTVASARAGIDALFGWAIEHPRALRLVLMEVGSTGPAGIERRERLLGRFEELLRVGLQLPPGPNPVLRAVIGGLNQVLYTRAQASRYGELSGLVPVLVGWATSYYPVPAVMMRLQERPAPAPPHAPALLAGGRAPGTLFAHLGTAERRGLVGERASVSRSLVVHSQRERILDAVANLTSERGYANVTCESIAEAAAVSLQAFYTHFTGKEDAFLVAYEVGHHKSLAAVQRGRLSAPDWQRGVREGIRALFEFLASEPAFAHMALVDALIATHRTAERSAKGAAAYARMLAPAAREAMPAPAARETALAARPPGVLLEAITGGLFELCFSQALRGRVRTLPELLPAATYFALAPFIGAE